MSDGPTDRAAVMAALAEFKDPETGRSIVEMEQVPNVQLADGRLTLTLALSTWAAPLWQETKAELEALLKARLPALATEVKLVALDRPPQKLGQIGLTCKSVIAVGSGKGGVGKSTIAATLALGLSRAGARVGLMDADVYGPSIPHLLGVNRRPEVADNRIQPIEVSGLKVMSMGFVVPAGDAVVWRGPMLHKALTQFLQDTEWGNLDYLIIDMPPGTGDVALSLSQLLPLTGAVIVCTPQDVALLDAVKAIDMFRKVGIPILGMVENMSYFLCPDNGKRYDIFGSGGAKRRAGELSIAFLGEVPIQIPIRARGDEGTTAQTFDDSNSAPFLEAICRQLVSNLAREHRQAPPLPSLNIL